MRLEIIIPDSTRPDLKAQLTSLTQRLSAKPELVEEIHLKGEDDNAAVPLSDVQIAKVRAAQADLKAGRVFTLEQSKANLEAHTKEWLAAHPS